MQTFLPLYLRNHVAQLTIAREMTGTIRNYFDPLKTVPLAELTPLQIEEWFHTIGDASPTMANKCLSILRTMFEKARDWRLFHGDNPAKRIKRYREHSRRRFVQPQEMPRLMEALHQESEIVQCYFLLCLLVGCRRTEALTLRWQDLDFVHGLWHKPHTKSDRAQTVPIPHVLLKRLDALPRQSACIFTHHVKPWSTSFVFEQWQQIRTSAGLPDVTIHDLRRTCASWMSCHGENLAVIGNVLNHSGLQHTAVYARLNISPISRALEANSARMLGSAPP